MAGLLLIIEGPDEGQSFCINVGQVVQVGRDPQSDFQINDPFISRTHFLVEGRGNEIVLIDSGSRHGTVVNDTVVKERILKIGDVIRIGKTHIEYQDSELVTNDQVSQPIISERVFKPNELKGFEFGDAGARLEILSILPKMISESKSDSDLASRLSKLLLASIPEANAAAAAIYPIAEVRAGDASVSSESDTRIPTPVPERYNEPKMMQSSSRDGYRFHSRRLIARTFEEGESVLHVWSKDSAESLFTMMAGQDWAFCTPVQGEACEGWCFYVAGSLSGQVASATSSKLLGHLRFAELVAQFIGAVRNVQLLEHRQSIMRRFFSPRVVETFSGKDTESALQPREDMISVMFCDVRGFSRQVEKSEHHLQDFLDRVSEALGVMTQAVMSHDGVIADFQGDSVLAFWGWPTPLEDGPLPACRTALGICRKFALAAVSEKHPLHGFNAGIGIGYGRAIAGTIGTRQQSKVGVFGSVVNVASRLEGMTKQFHVPILLDEGAAAMVRKNNSPTDARCRLLGQFQPKGMQRSVSVFQLLQSMEKDSSISNSYIEDYERAINAFFVGNWSEALKALKGFAADDRAAEIIISYANEHRNIPPDNWKGVIALQNK